MNWSYLFKACILPVGFSWENQEGNHGFIRFGFLELKSLESKKILLVDRNSMLIPKVFLDKLDKLQYS